MEITMEPYLVLEGQQDIEILKQILPKEQQQHFHFQAGGGKSSAISMATTLGLKKPVVLLVDSDSLDNSISEEHRQLLLGQLHRYSVLPRDYCQVLVAQPEIEGVLVSNRSVLEKVLHQAVNTSKSDTRWQALDGGKLDEVQWQKAQTHPKQFLKDTLGHENYIKLFFKIIGDNPSDLKKLQEHPLIKELIKALTTVSSVIDSVH
jgi:5S rRNA maturation endonuclease (ribonuclease M5)